MTPEVVDLEKGWIEERLVQLRDEAEVNLDRSMFAPHPDGYTCRCGIVESCVCPSTWPELVAAEQGATIRELRVQMDEMRRRELAYEHRGEVVPNSGVPVKPRDFSAKEGI